MINKETTCVEDKHLWKLQPSSPAVCVNCGIKYSAKFSGKGNAVVRRNV